MRVGGFGWERGGRRGGRRAIRGRADEGGGR